MTDINIHAGCHGLFESAPSHFFTKQQAIPELLHVKHISPGDFRKQWRLATLTGSSEDITVAMHSPLTIEALKERKYLHVLSNPNIIGNEKSVIKDGIIYPSAGVRLGRLAAVLEGFDITVKLIICELTLLSMVSSAKINRIHLINKHPWAEFAARLARDLKGIRLEIYAVKDLQNFSNHLAEIFFDPPVNITGLINEIQEKSLSDMEGKVLKYPADSQLDHYYDDLNAIRKVDGVDLYVL